MSEAKIALGFILLLLGAGYLYWPGMILKVNELAKRYVFNDSYILLNRRRWGLLLVILSLIAFLSGFHAFGKA